MTLRKAVFLEYTENLRGLYCLNQIPKLKLAADLVKRKESALARNTHTYTHTI